MRFNQYRIGDLCDVTSSKRIFAEEYVSEGVPFYRSKEIIQKHNNETITEPLYITRDRYNKIKEKNGVPCYGDLLLTSVGTLGIPYLVRNEEFYFKDGNLTWFHNFNDFCLSNYLYYYLDSDFGRNALISRAIGSSQAALTIDIIKKHKIVLPELKYQFIITNILKQYDKLIENNNNRIKILEQSAQEIYKEWFVRFRFPGYENSKFDNGIPLNWKIVRMGEIAEIKAGGDCPKEVSNIKTDLHNVPIYSNGLDEEGLYGFTNKAKIFNKSLTISARGTVGKVFLRNEPYVPIVRLITVEPNNEELLYYLFYYLDNDSITGNGTSQQQYTIPMAKKKKILLPDNSNLLAKFNNYISPLYNEICLLKNKNQNLIKQRDLLLPRLMSGKLEVK